MKTFLKLAGVFLFATSGLVDAAPNPASQDWVSHFVQNYTQALIPSLTYHAGSGISIDASNRISTLESDSFISYLGSPSRCTIGVDCPTSAPRNIFLTTLQEAAPGAQAPTYNSSTGEFTIQASGVYTIQYAATSILLYSFTPTPFQEIVVYQLIKNAQPLYASATMFTDLIYVGNTSGTVTTRLLAGDVLSLAYQAVQAGPPAPANGILAIDASTISPPGTTPPALSFAITRIS